MTLLQKVMKYFFKQRYLTNQTGTCILLIVHTNKETSMAQTEDANGGPKMIAIDFETFYTAEYSLSKMSTWAYIHDDRFDAYLVSAFDGVTKWVGHPTKFDWSSIDNALVLMHNASFDEMVLDHLRELGIVPPNVKPREVLCTADMVAWLGCKRDLKTASRELLHTEISKAVRSGMKGRTYQDAVEAGDEQALLDYGADDAVLCWQLADKYLDAWPENERELSILNREAGSLGIFINQELVESGFATLSSELAKVEALIPWVEAGDPPLSPHACRRQGKLEEIPVPASLAKDDPAVVEWREKYGEQYPWVKATGEYRSINMQLKRVGSIKDNLRKDGTMPYQIKYMGASTGRFSGGGDSGGKFNMQNMPRKAMYGVDVRPMFRARPGYLFVISDFSQIEARMLLWRVGDTEFLRRIEEEGNIYIAYALHTRGVKIEKGTPEYQLAKAQCLQLGYYSGAVKFHSTATKPPYNIDMTLAEAEAAVRQYREANPRVVNHWRQHQLWLNYSASHKDKTHEVLLPSGRSLMYYNPRRSGNEVTASYTMGSPAMKLHSGILTNNEIQAASRDVLRDAWLAVHAAGYRVVLSVHDELVVEVHERLAHSSVPEIEHLMVSSSPWAAGCPLAVETVVTDHYCK